MFIERLVFINRHGQFCTQSETCRYSKFPVRPFDNRCQLKHWHEGSFLFENQCKTSTSVGLVSLALAPWFPFLSVPLFGYQWISWLRITGPDNFCFLLMSLSCSKVLISMNFSYEALLDWLLPFFSTLYQLSPNEFSYHLIIHSSPMSDLPLLNQTRLVP